MTSPGMLRPVPQSLLPKKLLPRKLIYGALLLPWLGSAGLAQTGTPLMVQMPQLQTPAAPGLKLPFQLLALPDTTTMPAYVQLTLGRPADRLDVTGQPQGMSVTVQGDVLTILTRGVAEGQYPLRITGLWGTEQHSAELLVSVYKTGVASVPSGTVPPAPIPTIPTPTVPTPTVPTPTVPAITTPAPTLPTVSVTTTPAAQPVPVPLPTPTPVPVPAPAPVTTTPSIPTMPTPTLPTPSIPTVKQQDIPQATTPSNVLPNASIPFQPTLPSTGTVQAGPVQLSPVKPERFTVWGGMGTVGLLTGVNVGLSAPVWQRNALSLAVRGTAELYPVRTSGVSSGLPTLGADLLLSRSGSRLYYGPTTSLALGSGSGWSFGGLLGYSLPLGQGPLNYYLEGRARYAYLGGKSTFSPGFKVGFTYRLGR